MEIGGTTADADDVGDRETVRDAERVRDSVPDIERLLRSILAAKL